MFLISKVIKENRERLGMTKEELAQKLNSPVSTIEMWERGEIYVGSNTIVKLANALKISCNDLLGRPDYEDIQVKTMNGIIQDSISSKWIGNISDGYHTFNELYHHRAMLTIALCNLCPELFWKSKKHDDGSMYDGMFIVGMNTKEGSATYHYDINPYWDMFCCNEVPTAPEFDGHTPADAINRIYEESKRIRDAKHLES